MTTVWILLAAGALLGTVALVAFLWGVRNGVFENAEDTKYVLFHDEDEEDPPA